MGLPAATCTHGVVTSSATEVADEGTVDVEREVTVAGRRIRAGTREDAGKLCRTPQSPDGISAERYRWYLTHPTVNNRPPGPIMHRDASGEPAPLRDGRTGRELYDLDAVEAWNAARPGKGSRRATLRTDTLRETPTRRTVLDAAADRELRVTPVGVLVRGDKAPPRTAGAVTELQQIGVLAAPTKRDGAVALTATGKTVLARWVTEQR